MYIVTGKKIDANMEKARVLLFTLVRRLSGGATVSAVTG